jgi:hypothetical protein
MVVAESATAAGREDKALAFFGYFELYLAGFGIAGHGTKWHLDHNILALSTGAQVTAAALAILGKKVLAVLQVQQRPELGTALQDNVAAPTPVAAVGAAVGQALGPEEVVRARAAFARAAGNLDVVDEVVISHVFLNYKLGIKIMSQLGSALMK